MAEREQEFHQPAGFLVGRRIQASQEVAGREDAERQASQFRLRQAQGEALTRLVTIVGVGGVGFTVITVAVEGALLQPPFVTTVV